MKRPGFRILCADALLAALILSAVAWGGKTSGTYRGYSQEDAVADKSTYDMEQKDVIADKGTYDMEQKDVIADKDTYDMDQKDVIADKGAYNIDQEEVEQTVKADTGIQEKKQVAITFDDGPDPVYTPELLAGLKERNVKATFFLLGKQVEQYPDIVKKMYEDGHIIGCHSYEHVDLSQLSEEDACAQVKQICDLIYEITEERPSFVRPPYGEWLPCLDEDFCMIPVLWDVDPLDWATKDARLVADRVLEDVEEYDIILMHDASESSVQAALQIIDAMQADGYEFVTVDQLIFP